MYVTESIIQFTEVSRDLQLNQIITTGLELAPANKPVSFPKVR